METTMILAKADGSEWRIERVAEKLRLRAGLPGARVFDLATEGLRKARAAGIPGMDRLALALPASWCVNSPAPSTVLRRWALPPQNEVWMALLEVLEDRPPGPLDAEATESMPLALRALGDEPFLVEAVSKVLALLAPDAVPLMPSPARAFVLGAGVHAVGREPANETVGPEPAYATDGRAFVAMLNWFSSAVEAGGAELASAATAHGQVPLSAAQVLDRLLWFDSEGHRHFPKLG
jgi:hypothetical protein